MTQLNEKNATIYDKVYKMVAFYKHANVKLYTEKDFHDEEIDLYEEENSYNSYFNLGIVLNKADNFQIKEEYILPIQSNSIIQYATIRKLSQQEQNDVLNNLTSKDKEKFNKSEKVRERAIEWCKNNIINDIEGYISLYPDVNIFLYQERRENIYFYTSWLGDDCGTYDIFDGYDVELEESLNQKEDVMISLMLLNEEETHQHSILGYGSIMMSEESNLFRELCDLNDSDINLIDFNNSDLIFFDKDKNSIQSNKNIILIIKENNEIQILQNTLNAKENILKNIQ